jgi:hypothetical protein
MCKIIKEKKMSEDLLKGVEYILEVILEYELVYIYEYKRIRVIEKLRYEELLMI